MARKSRCMPDKFINKQGNGVTDAFLDYARPLVGRMPIMERISAPLAKKVLNKK